MQFSMETYRAKVRATGKKYHYWRWSPRGWVAICNPGLIRVGDGLHNLTGGERLCKVCAIHLLQP
jgi:hypothetical protein